MTDRNSSPGGPAAAPSDILSLFWLVLDLAGDFLRPKTGVAASCA